MGAEPFIATASLLTGRGSTANTITRHFPLAVCLFIYSRSAGREIPRVLWSCKIHYRDNKSPPRISITNRLSEFYRFTLHVYITKKKFQN
jgi:hypothetical protein